jgi:hypothetical protein
VPGGRGERRRLAPREAGVTKRATFTKADLDRALSVARKHGMTIEIARDGTIRVVEAIDAKPVSEEPENPLEARRRRLAAKGA